MSQAALPDDILHLLCEELAAQDQFDTLFNCACSSRILAVPALTHLYRYVTMRKKGNLRSLSLICFVGLITRLRLGAAEMISMDCQLPPNS
jgi:hypothetical protein